VIRTRVLLAALAIPAAATTGARADGRALPFTYPAAPMPSGQVQIEQSVDATPVPAPLANDTLKEGWTARLALPTELRYAASSRIELHDQIVLVEPPSSTGRALALEGARLRVRGQLLDDADRGLFIAAWGTLGLFFDEVGSEQRFLGEARHGRFALAANGWLVEAYRRDIGASVRVGATVAATVSPIEHLALGLEYWTLSRLRTQTGNDLDAAAADDRTHHLAGGTLTLDLGKVHWVSGLYLRIDHTGDPIAPTDRVGRVYLRSMLGFGF
jgi:hypothetical protein